MPIQSKSADKNIIESINEGLSIVDASSIWKTNDWNTSIYQPEIYRTTPNTYTTISTTSTTMQATTDIHVNDVIIKGKSLSEALEEINERLLMISRNKLMENKYPELKEAYDKYNNILTTLLAMEAVTGDNSLD